jgi:hypothetical protein
LAGRRVAATPYDAELQIMAEVIMRVQVIAEVFGRLNIVLKKPAILTDSLSAIARLTRKNDISVNDAGSFKELLLCKEASKDVELIFVEDAEQFADVFTKHHPRTGKKMSKMILFQRTGWIHTTVRSQHDITQNIKHSK